MSKTDDLKAIGQLRKAILPLVDLMKAQANEELSERLASLETSVNALLEKQLEITVNAPEVKVDMDVQAIVKALEAQNLKKADPTPIAPSPYEPHDQAKTNTFSFAGFLRSDGAWYIQRVAKGEQRYAKGNGDYSQSWENRAKLTYGYMNE